MRGICTKNWSDISIRGQENHRSPKPEEHTERRTDICFYRVALLLKIQKSHYIMNCFLNKQQTKRKSMHKN